jgi:N-methylhydantoinase B/oxoprolinase/acetone carboxylase alpha subunit
VRYIIRAITDPDIPNNEGCYRMIDITLPEGSLLNPKFPAPVNSRSTTLRRVGDVIMGALAQAMPGFIPAASNGHPLWAMFGGDNPATGKPFIATEIGTGGMGGRPTRDGVDCIATDSSNAMNVPVEMIELNAPLRIDYYRLRPDSGGAGKFRGGCGFVKQYTSLVDGVRVSHRGERHFSQPWGLRGGQNGASSRTIIIRASGRREIVPSKQEFVLNRGDRLQMQTSGGGGYGDPRQRDPKLVLRDVRDQKVSAVAARKIYGIAIKGGAIDERATEKLRRRPRKGKTRKKN